MQARVWIHKKYLKSIGRAGYQYYYRSHHCGPTQSINVSHGHVSE